MSAEIELQRRDSALSVLGGPTSRRPVGTAGGGFAGRQVGDTGSRRRLGPLSEGVDDIVAAFDQAGISSVLRVAAHGEWIDLVDAAGR